MRRSCKPKLISWIVARAPKGLKLERYFSPLNGLAAIQRVNLEIQTPNQFHNIELADIDGDFDNEVFAAKWQINGYWGRHQVDLWEFANKKSLWKKHVIGNSEPRRNLFVTTGDLNGDDFTDIATGLNWYKNPGTLSGQWQQVRTCSLRRCYDNVYAHGHSTRPRR